MPQPLDAYKHLLLTLERYRLLFEAFQDFFFYQFDNWSTSQYWVTACVDEFYVGENTHMIDSSIFFSENVAGFRVRKRKAIIWAVSNRTIVAICT